MASYRRVLGSATLWLVLAITLRQTDAQGNCNLDTGSKFFSPTLDGSFNNLAIISWCRNGDRRARRQWGASVSAYARLLGPTYGDFFEGGFTDNSEPRIGQIGGPRSNPNAACSTSRSGSQVRNVREISVAFHQLVNSPDDFERTLMMVFWGQFIAHDVAFAVGTSSRTCCNPDPAQRAEECLPIEVNEDDPFYGPKNVRCLRNARSKNLFENSNRVREQINRVTSFIDASTVYGSGSEEELVAGEVLDCSTGKMIVETVNGKEFPPVNTSTSRSICGDTRCADSPGLFTMHTLFVREHNRIVDQLSGMGPLRKYRIARRIVMAEIQNIVYSEYLPTVLGNRVMRAFRLGLPEFFRWSLYRTCVNPTVFNAFGTAAFRFGHSMISKTFTELDPTNRNSNADVRRYHKSFGNFSLTKERSGNNLEWILHGGITQRAQLTDRLFVEDVTNLLFPRGMDFGSDLVSRNIMRGRDHGLPSYMRFRKACGLDVACNGWSDRPSNISPEKWSLLEDLYDHPNNIDLFTGGTAENPVLGGAVGDTFACIIGRQFHQLKFGDRFFFTHFNPFTGFNVQQLNNLRQRTLRDVICENTDIAETRRNVFLKEDTANPSLPCAEQFVSELNIPMLSKAFRFLK